MPTAMRSTTTLALAASRSKWRARVGAQVLEGVGVGSAGRHGGRMPRAARRVAPRAAAVAGHGMSASRVGHGKHMWCTAYFDCV